MVDIDRYETFLVLHGRGTGTNRVPRSLVVCKGFTSEKSIPRFPGISLDFKVGYLQSWGTLLGVGRRHLSATGATPEGGRSLGKWGDPPTLGG